jgi:formylglycine-generating enzyme required for sulfatase activity
MGSNYSQVNFIETQHLVYVDAFWVDKLEISNGQYRSCVNSGTCTPPNSINSATRNFYYSNPEYDRYPVIYVSWQQVVNYCEWAGKRLLTEAEWEKAARGGLYLDGDRLQKRANPILMRVYPWGNDFDKTKVNSAENGLGDTVAVGSNLAGASPYGVLDLAGNVWEWLFDSWSEGYYSNSPSRNPKGPPDNGGHVVRGGTWSDTALSVRVSLRNFAWYTLQAHNLGARCAMTP